MDNKIIRENLNLPFEKSFHGILRRTVGNEKIILPGVRIVVRNNPGHFLFIKRSDNGVWGMPAGSVEFNESVTQAAHRELLEETGLEAEDMKLIALHTGPQFDFTNAHGGKHQMFAVVFEAVNWSGRISTKTDETEDCRFFAPDNLPKTHPWYIETVNDVLSLTDSVIVK